MNWQKLNWERYLPSQSGRSVKLITCMHLVQKLRMLVIPAVSPLGKCVVSEIFVCMWNRSSSSCRLHKRQSVSTVCTKTHGVNKCSFCIPRQCPRAAGFCTNYCCSWRRKQSEMNAWWRDGRWCCGAARVRSEMCLQKIPRKTDMCSWRSACRKPFSCSSTESRSCQSPSLASGLWIVLDLHSAKAVQDILLVSAFWVHLQEQHYPLHILAVIVWLNIRQIGRKCLFKKKHLKYGFCWWRRCIVDTCAGTVLCCLTASSTTLSSV